LVIDDHITGVYADAEFYPAIAIDPGIPIGQPTLHIEPAADRVYGAVKLDQKPIAEGPDQSTMVFGNCGFDKAFYMGCKADVCILFVNTH
jgi:hypothetical protein